jgi:hypothetical protein
MYAACSPTPLFLPAARLSCVLFSFKPASQMPTFLFSSALLSLVLGFGLFFDHLADTKEVRHLARWAVDSRDHRGLPFVIVDKARGRLFAFDAKGELRGSTPVKMNARHDGSEPAEFPAGPFVAMLDRHLSDGSLQVSPEFFREHLYPLRMLGSVAYVLPEAPAGRERSPL